MQGEDLWKIQEKYDLILNEGYLHIPENVIKEIKDYYILNFKKFYKSSSNEITEDEYPSKVFYLDLTGTSFEFFNYIKPKPSVLVKFISGASKHLNYEKDVFTIRTKNQGNIHLELVKDPQIFRELLSYTIEHEVIHFIQHLLFIYKNKMAGSTNKSLFRPNTDIHGYSQTKEGIPRRKVRHSFRPIEYYPDLVSSIRELHKLFYDKFHATRDWNMFRQWERPKVYFFKNFLEVANEEKEDELFDNSLAVQTFREFKKLSPEFYKKILKVAYNAFVNNDPNFDPKEIEDQLISIGND